MRPDIVAGPMDRKWSLSNSVATGACAASGAAVATASRVNAIRWMRVNRFICPPRGLAPPVRAASDYPEDDNVRAGRRRAFFAPGAAVRERPTRPAQPGASGRRRHVGKAVHIDRERQDLAQWRDRGANLVHPGGLSKHEHASATGGTHRLPARGAGPLGARNDLIDPGRRDRGMQRSLPGPVLGHEGAHVVEVAGLEGVRHPKGQHLHAGQRLQHLRLPGAIGIKDPGHCRAGDARFSGVQE